MAQATFMFLQNNDQSALTPTNNQIPPTDTSKNSDEINVLWYLLIVWRRKWLVLSVFFIILLGFGIKISMMSPIFKTTALIKIGKIRNEKIEENGNIKAFFSETVVLEKIAVSLNLAEDINTASVAKMFTISEDNINKSEFLVISGNGETPSDALKVVQVVSEHLLGRHSVLFDNAKHIIDIEIDLLNRGREKTKQDIQLMKSEITQLDQEIKYYQSEVDKRSKIESDGQGRIVESYLDLLKDAKTNKQDKLTTIKNLEYDLMNFDITVLKLKYELGKDTYFTKVETAPVLPQFKIGPKRKQLAIQSGIVAIFVSLITSFVVEYLAHCKKNYSYKSN